MKLTVLLTVVASLCAGTLGALLVTDNGNNDTSAAQLADMQDLKAQVGDLIESQASLARTVEALRDRPPSVIQAAVAAQPIAGTVESSSVREEAAAQPTEAVSEEQFKEQVGEALSEIRAREEQERDEEREDRRQQAFDRNLERLAEQLNLDLYQTDQLRLALETQNEKSNAIRASIRETGDWGGIRDAYTELHAETKQSLSVFLSADQLQKYDESNSNHFGGGGWGGFRGGRSGGGN